MVLFVVVAFVALSLSTTQSAYYQCTIARDNSQRLNAFVDTIVASVKSSPSLTQAEKAQRVVAYSSIKAKLPICRRLW